MWLIDKIEDLFPQTPLAYLIYLAFFIFFGILMIVMISKLKPSKKEQKNKNKELTLDDLLEVANNPKSDRADLIVAIELFYQNFKVSQDEKKAFEFFEKVLNHKNRDKNIFNIFHGKILPANIEYKDRLDKLERKALNK